MKTNLLLAVCTVFLFNCSKMKDLTDTGATTKEMSQKLDTTNQSTSELLEGTDRLQGLTSNMYVQLRLKEAEESRDRRSKNLLEASSFQQKVTEAAAYLKAFEYQYWTGEEAAGDDQHIREEKMMIAAQEFFRFLAELISLTKEQEIDDIFDPSITMKNKTAMAINAISLALHQIDDYQKILIEEQGIKKVHMLNMIKDSLLKLRPLETGEISFASLKDYEKEVLENAELAQAILKIRVNTFSSMALSKVSDISHKGDAGKFMMMTLGWDAHYHTLNIAQQDKVLRYLREGNKTRDYLLTLGANNDDLIDSNLRTLWSKMRVEESSCPAENLCNREKETRESEFTQLVSDLLTKE